MVSPSSRQAVMSKKSTSSLLERTRFTASPNSQTGMPLLVNLSSGSLVRLPASTTRLKLTTFTKPTISGPSGDGWAVLDPRAAQPGAQTSRAKSGVRRATRGPYFPPVSPLFAAFGGCEAVDPLIGVGAGELTQGFAYTALEPGDTILAPELLGEGLEEVDLALSSFSGPAPTSPGGFLRGLLLRGLSNGLESRIGPAVRGGAHGRVGPSLFAHRARRLIVGGRGVVSVGELFEGGSADVHRVAQGT